MSVIGLDVGTSGCKALILGEDGTILKTSYRNYGLITPQPGWAELDPNVVWNSVKHTIKELTCDLKTDPVKAISISSMSDTMTPCDENSNPVGNSIVSFDTRNILEADLFSEILGRKWIYKITGQSVHPTYTITKILWIQRNKPDLFMKANKYLCMKILLQLNCAAKQALAFQWQQEQWLSI